jgi:hypothetical protein
MADWIFHRYDSPPVEGCCLEVCPDGFESYSHMDPISGIVLPPPGNTWHEDILWSECPKTINVSATPPEGYEFRKWLAWYSTIAYGPPDPVWPQTISAEFRMSIDNSTSPNESFTVAVWNSGNPEFVTGGWKIAWVQALLKIHVVIVNGTGSGNYLIGETINIAPIVPVGKVFDRWVNRNNVGFVADSRGANTTLITVGDENYYNPDMIFEATFKDIPPAPIIVEAIYDELTNYTLTVIDGTGSGQYVSGTVVPIVANTAPVGKIFDKWSNGDINPSTTVTVIEDMTITALYKLSNLNNLLIRGGTTAEWSAVNPVLRSKEISVDTTLNKLKVGDGITTWNDLSYLYNGVEDRTSDYAATAANLGKIWMRSDLAVPTVKMVIYQDGVGTGYAIKSFNFV